MKKSTASLVFIISMLALACDTMVETPQLDFNPEQVTYVRYNVKNCISDKFLRAFYSQTLPAGQEIIDFVINSDTSFVQRISLNHPLYINLIEGKGHVILFSVPDDTLTVNLDYSDNKSLVEAINFQGLTGPISKYLTFDRYRHKDAPKENQSVADFNSMIDSLYGQELEKINALGQSGALPDWFLNLEKNNIRYEREGFKSSQYGKRYAFYKQFFPREPDLPQNIDFSNMKYYWLENAHRTLASVKPDKYDSLIQPQSITLQISLESTQDNIDQLTDRLSEDALSLFVASRISVLFLGRKLLRLSPADFKDRKQGIDDLLQKNEGLITDTLIYNYLIKERSKAYQAVMDKNILTEGDNTPYFYLSDINGKFHRLSDYSGKVVMLNFWGTYCSPCIENIPKYNRIVEKFEKEEFELINICTDFNFEKWEQLINTHNFKGVQLICKGNWERKLRTEYDIYTNPHYTIIGEDGRIIKNNVKDSINNIIAASL